MIKTNRDGAKIIELTKALLLFKNPKRYKIKFFFPEAPGLKKFYGFRNCRFRISKGATHKPYSIENLRVFIRLPFFYWDKHNNGWEFGFPNLYLWWHVARVQSRN